jgi:hypothetical protein
MVALAVAGLAAAAGVAIAAGNEEPHDRMNHGSMGNMMDMMGSCDRMMKESPSGAALPQLPPGNEKLQMQMQAEMMQKMGAILSKYAARIGERPESPR